MLTLALKKKLGEITLPHYEIKAVVKPLLTEQEPIDRHLFMSTLRESVSQERTGCN